MNGNRNFSNALELFEPMKTKSLALFLGLTWLSPLAARAQINYAISGETAFVTNSPNAAGNIVIASTYNGYPVTRIGDEAFYYNAGVTSVTIPGSVTNIGNDVFFACPNLTSVTIPDSVTRIGVGAFYICDSLTSVTIPNSVISIGNEAFSDCISLTNITVNASNPAYSSVNGVLFDKTQKVLFQYPIGLTNSGYITPKGVTFIGADAFGYCTNLTSVIIPNSVSYIDVFGFYECTGLTNITFQGNAPSLGSNVFDHVAATVYYYTGTSGWSAIFGGLSTVELSAPPNPPQITAGSAGVKTGGNFGFSITGVNNQIIVVEASTDLVNWQPIRTNTLSGNSTNFTDAQWKNYPKRFYRAR
jgi:BspA type Leucine rich repeat region (6 copies)